MLQKLTWELWPLNSASLSLKAADSFPLCPPPASESAAVGDKVADCAHLPPDILSNRYTCRQCSTMGESSWLSKSLLHLLLWLQQALLLALGCGGLEAEDMPGFCMQCPCITCHLRTCDLSDCVHRGCSEGGGTACDGF